jgi:hypothetical protein
MLLITVFALVAAAAFGVIAWRAVRREALRSEARVASLAAAIDEVTASDDAFDWQDWPDENAAAPVQATALFDPGHQYQRRPLLTAGVGLAAVLAVVVLIAMTGDRHDTSTEALAGTARESLELLSMRHAVDGSTLAVTGLVRNRSDRSAGTITAVVSAFDRDGHVVANGSAPLSTFAPGDEAFFLVTIPHVNGLARYRVTFRTNSGVVRHVDRRAVPASAAS